MAGRTSLTLAEGMTGMMEGVFINIKNRSKVITAEVEVPAGGANGTVIAQGGRFGGWSLYVKNGVPAYDYNFLGLQRTSITSNRKLAPGKAELRFQFEYDGGGPGKGGKGTLFVNGQQVAEGRIPATEAGLFSADETADVGIDLGTPVVEAIGAEAKSRFTGRISRVTVAVKDKTASGKADEETFDSSSLFALGALVQEDLVHTADAVGAECKNEIASYCKDLGPGDGRILTCLNANHEKLSPRCEFVLRDASAQLGRVKNAVSYATDECRADLKTFCSNVEPGQGRLLDCLEKHRSEISKRCISALKKD